MGRNELIAAFQDTMSRSMSPILKNETEIAAQSSRIYLEGFRSKKRVKQYEAEIIVEENTTFTAARKHLARGRTAVLNFANPETPGGGVRNGAMAQEECLCRSSNLYACLNASSFPDYYQYHRELHNHFYSNRLIYTKGVTVFKDDSDIPNMLDEKDWFQVDVITCAAPYIAKRRYTNMTALKALFKGRIKNIFEVAAEHEIEVLILGAFGCGAFKNPPDIVAKAFREVIEENNYKGQFTKIVFAIKSTVNSDPFEPCPNIMAFETEFYVLSAEANKLRFSDNWALAQAVGSVKMPSGRVLKGGDQFNPYKEWQAKNKYYGKQFSILGDSISTLDGYNPRGYNLFYTGEVCDRTGVHDMKDTWWGKVIDFFGGELLVNNSWSGSRVTKLPDSDKLFPAGCSDERTSSLHINDTLPDVIIVYLGTNDWARGVEARIADHLLGQDEMEIFEDAYAVMLRKLRSNYPNAEIWCCTLNSTFMSCKPSFVFPKTPAGKHIDDYNWTIRNVAAANNCKVIDFDKYGWAYNSVDGSHPMSAGMDTLAMMVIREMGDESVHQIIDCPNNTHNYEVVEEYTGGTRFVCRKCGKESHVSTLTPPKFEKEDDTDYVMLPPDITTILYSDTLHLTQESTGKDISIQKPLIRVGRHSECDLRVDSSKNYVARFHASFIYERSIWFLRDDNSTNGTWLNGQKIKPGVKYQLNADDKIDFAHSETFIFEKVKKHNDEKLKGDEEEKAMIYLQVGMSAFKESEYKDEVALKMVISSLAKIPMYFPVEIDLEAMFGNIDPTTLKKGDTIQPSKDVKVRILTLKLPNGDELVPMFTSVEELNKGRSFSTVRYYPQDFTPMLMQMGKTAVINPFSDERFLVNQELIRGLLYPLVKLHNDEKLHASSCTVNDPMIGMIIENKYEVIREIGRGGVSRVFLGLDKSLNRTLTIKAYNKTQHGFNTVVYNGVMQETHMMMKLEHPCIPHIIDLVENENHLFIIREYVEGRTLDSIVGEHGPMPVETAINIAKEICGTLHYLHTLTPPHIHRDIKPANLILTSEGNVKLVDFGIMRLYDPKKSMDTACLGTKGYAAPEQYGGMGQTDARTDIFGLGMTMFHLVTGINPNDPPYEIKPIRQINPALPKRLEEIICKCIESNPDKRYQSAATLLTALSGEKTPDAPKGLWGKLFRKK